MRITFSFAGVLRTGGLLLLTCVSLPLMAQQQADRPVEKSARVIERGAHHARWERITEAIDPETGQTNTITSSYEQLETGLHFLDARGGWQSASEKIEVIPGYAVASQAQHQARWAANLNTYGAIEFWTPEGEPARSHILGLAYFDPATGASVMLAEIKDSIGTVSGNQVTYEDAFDAVDASVRYRFTKGGFEQDIIVTAKLPDPALWGFDPNTVQLQVLTEFVVLPDRTTAQTRDELLSSEGLNQNLIRSTREDFTRDYQVGFGAMQMAEGRAFRLSDGFGESAITVRKKLETFEGNRKILVETVDFREVAPLANELPESSKPTATTSGSSRTKMQASATRVAPAAPARQTADARLMKVQDGRQLAQADSGKAGRGLVIDYTLLGSTSNLTLQADTTYYVTGPVTATGTTTIEGNTVVKFANTNSPYLKLQGTYTCLTAPYRPAIFTSALDGTVGEAISYTNSATAYYAANALWIDSNTSDLRHIHIRDAWTGIYVASGASSPHTFSHVQLINCQNGVVTAGPTFQLRNGLLNNVLTNFHSTASATGHVEHLTANVASILKGSTSLTLNVTNSLLVQITNASTINSSAGNASYASSSGLFQTAIAGQHYLAAGSTNRNAGVPTISTQLKTDLHRLSTYPPTVVTATYVTSSKTYSPVVQRDTDTPDRGYHYQPLDYVFNAVIITNATVILTNGVCIGTAYTYGYGLNVRPNGYLSSEGKPDALNRIVQYSTVQEQTTAGFTSAAAKSVTAYHSYSGALGLAFRFTQFSMFTTNLTHIMAGYSAYPNVILRDCELGAGRIWIDGSSYLSATNCLFERSLLYLRPYTSPVTFFNSTFIGGTVDLRFSGNPWSLTVKDNLFDQTTISHTSPYSGTYVGGYNGYVTNYSRWSLYGDTGDVILPTPPVYESAALGNRYLPAGNSLFDHGSRTADNAGLYHFTTFTSQAKETNSTVDIGFHYVALDGNGLPFDTDADGLPDYFEDANGNSTYDTGDYGNWNSIDTDGDGIADVNDPNPLTQNSPASFLGKLLQFCPL